MGRALLPAAAPGGVGVGLSSIQVRHAHIFFFRFTLPSLFRSVTECAQMTLEDCTALPIVLYHHAPL